MPVFVIDMLVFPLNSDIDLSGTTASSSVLVSPSITLTFLDQPLLHERVEIGIEPTVMDFFFVAIFELIG